MFKNGMNKRVHIVVSGKVQGVSFRSKVKNMADELNIYGYVKNVDDDKIEAIFEGDQNAIKNMLDFCKDGPEDAEVSAIVIDEENYNGEFNKFSIIDK